MSEGKFDPAQHLIQLPGRGGKGPTDYLPVAARIAWFRADHPDGKLHVWKDQIDERIAIFHAQAETSDGAIAQGWGSETPQDFKDYIEKASTKAVGRALAALGYGTLQAGDELDEGARIVDTPKPQTTPRAGTTPGREPAPRSSEHPTDRPAAVPSAAGPSSPDKGKRAPTFAEARQYALDETISAKGRLRAATIALELAGSLDELADTYSKVMALPERAGLKETYETRHKALKELEAVPF
jgi:hypothetical protein